MHQDIWMDHDISVKEEHVSCFSLEELPDEIVLQHSESLVRAGNPLVPEL